MRHLLHPFLSMCCAVFENCDDAAGFKLLPFAHSSQPARLYVFVCADMNERKKKLGLKALLLLSTWRVSESENKHKRQHGNENVFCHFCAIAVELCYAVKRKWQ